MRGRSMPKPCSQDLRERVLEAVEAGASRREAAEYYEISASSAIKWMQRWHATGSVAPKPSGGSVSPLEKHGRWLLGLIAKQPDLTLDEIVAAMRKGRIAGSRSAVWRFFQRHNISFKKNPAGSGARASRYRSRAAALDARSAHVRAGPTGIYRRDRHLNQYGASSRSLPARHAIDRPRAPWTLEEAHLRGRAAPSEDGRTLRA